MYDNVLALNFAIKYLPFTRKKKMKFRMENQMVRANPFPTFCKLLAAGSSDTRFEFVSVFSVNLDTF